MDSNASSIERFCGIYDNENPLVVSSEGNKMVVKFHSDRLFRYKGFQCRYRAMQSNGISVINSFVDESQGKFQISKFQHSYIKWGLITLMDLILMHAIL